MSTNILNIFKVNNEWVTNGMIFPDICICSFQGLFNVLFIYLFNIIHIISFNWNSLKQRANVSIFIIKFMEMLFSLNSVARDRFLFVCYLWENVIERRIDFYLNSSQILTHFGPQLYICWYRIQNVGWNILWIQYEWFGGYILGYLS